MVGDIAIPSVVDSEPMYFDDYSKVGVTPSLDLTSLSEPLEPPAPRSLVGVI